MGEFGPKRTIADLNDEFRRRGQCVATASIAALDSLGGLIEAVRTYDDFTPDNDPWGEHDFGKLEWEGDDVFWKIDYYNESYDGLGDSSSPHCNRVLTMMFASEY
jgi:hypothetical protein